MTVETAHQLLKVPPGAGLEVIGRLYGEKRSELAARQAQAPTPGLKEKYARQVAELGEAFAVASKALLEPTNLPRTEPNSRIPSPEVVRAPGSATRERPYVNSLGMKFVPVPITGGPTGGKRVLFGTTEVRVKDFAAFVREAGHDMTKGEAAIALEPGGSWKKPGFEQSEDHPVVCVSWEDAKAFCAWLTQKEGREYRLPSDHEWSCAVGIGAREDASASPKSKDMEIADVYPWDTGFPPPAGAGNYGEFEGYRDGYSRTAPVGSFAANEHGLHDLGGNVWEWCEDKYDSPSDERVLRGGSWFVSDPRYLLSSCRNRNVPGFRVVNIGFRCVLVVSGG